MPSSDAAYLDSSAVAGAEARVAADRPDGGLRIQQDHVMAFQSDGSVAGSKGSS